MGYARSWWRATVAASAALVVVSWGAALAPSASAAGCAGREVESSAASVDSPGRIPARGSASCTGDAIRGDYASASDRAAAR